MSARIRILVVGGAGAFGRRLVEGLLATTDAVVVVAGRSSRPDVVQDLRQLYGEARVEAVQVDRDCALETLRAVKPFCVVDAAGPFQGAAPHLARAAVAAGCHYVDLADARDFVANFHALDAAAREAGILAATGASSTPALSGAALASLTDGWRQVEEIAVAISPGNRAPRGLSVVEAILAYAGKPVRVRIGGRWTVRPGWGACVRRDMPGLGRRWLSLCETPDLDILPARHPGARTVLFRAGLELSLLHLGLWLMTLPVRWGLVPSLRPLAGPLRAVAALFERFGTDRGGMMVEAVGTDRDGRRAQAVWSLVAEAGDGPVIPVLPALALVRALLAGRITATGATLAGDCLALGDIEAEFARFRITVTRASRYLQGSLFERALGPAVERLPSIVRDVHTRGTLRLRGRVAIKGARHRAARLVARCFGFPGSAPDEEAEVLLKRQGEREVWIRRFGRATFRSTLRAGPLPHRLEERFGPFRFDLAVDVHPAGFDLAIAGWRIGPFRLPLRLAPHAPGRAFVDPEGRYRFDVAIALPLVGPLIRYRGWLLPEAG